LLVPCTYLILEDLKSLFDWWWRGLRGKQISAEAVAEVQEVTS